MCILVMYIYTIYVHTCNVHIHLVTVFPKGPNCFLRFLRTFLHARQENPYLWLQAACSSPRIEKKEEEKKEELYKKQGWERVETTKWTYYSLVFRINNRGKSAWKPQNGLITVSLSSDDMVNNNLYMGRNSTIRYWSQVDLWILFGCEF